MATVEQHLSKAENNEVFTSFIGNNHNYIDWKFVALYYSALHFGDAFIAKKLGYGRYRIGDHVERRLLYNDLFDAETFFSYERLEKFSRYARYHPEKINLLTEENYNDLLTNDFKKMKSLSQHCK